MKTLIADRLVLIERKPDIVDGFPVEFGPKQRSVYPSCLSLSVRPSDKYSTCGVMRGSACPNALLPVAAPTIVRTAAQFGREAVDSGDERGFYQA